MSDMKGLTFSIIAFFVILSAGLGVVYYPMVSNGKTVPIGYNELGNLTAEGSQGDIYLQDVAQSKRDVDEGKKSFWQQIPGIGDAVVYAQDSFESNMVVRAFKTAKTIMDSDKVADNVQKNTGINSVLGLSEVPWLKWGLSIFLPILVLLVILYFMRGIS